MSSYRFDDYRLDSESLELRRADLRIALEPQVFALLLYLIERRHRVVSKRELLESIWRGADVSDSVIHRAVVKLRGALADGGHAQLVRTVHRIGYQFIGEVIDDAHGAPSQQRERSHKLAAEVPLAPGGAAPRVAVLPLHNLTADPEQDWASWGIPRLAFGALERERGIAMVDMEQVRQALSSLPADLSTPEHVGGLLGARWVLEGWLVNDGPSSCALRYIVHGGPRGTAVLTAPDSAGLAEPLTQALRLLAGLPDGWQMRSLSSDPLVLQALARAQEMEARADWAAAAQLLEVVLALEPGNTGARLRTLPYLPHASAEEEGAKLLAGARRAGDVRLQAATHEALGRASFRRLGAEWSAFSARHLTEALALSRPWENEDWVVRMHLNLGYVFQLRREHAAALQAFEAAQRGMRRGNNAIFLVAALNNRAIIENFQEQPLVACDLAKQALDVCEHHRLEQLGYIAHATTSLAESELGWLGRAGRRCLGNLQRLTTQRHVQSESASWPLLVGAHLCVVQRGDPALSEAMLAVRGKLGELSPRARVIVAATDAMTPLLSGSNAGLEERATEDLLDVMSESERGGFREHTHHFAALALELALSARSPRALARIRQAVHRLSTLGEDAGLARALLRADAAEALWRGDAPAVLHALELARAGVPAGRVQALARLDLSWRLACNGQVEEAQAEVAGVRQWMEALPQGLCLRARCLALRGAWEAAADLQLEALRRRWPQVPAGWSEAFDAYAHGRLPTTTDDHTLLTLS